MKYVFAAVALVFAWGANATASPLEKCWWNRGLINEMALATTIVLEAEVLKPQAFSFQLISSTSNEGLITDQIFGSAKSTLIRCQALHRAPEGTYTIQFGPKGITLLSTVD